jgi:hypothetical protein
MSSCLLRFARTHLSLEKDAPFSRAVERAGRFFAAQFSAGCTTNMSGFDCRQAHDREHRIARRSRFKITSCRLQTAMLHMRDRRQTRGLRIGALQRPKRPPAAAAMSRTDSRSGSASIAAAVAISTTE